MEEHKNSFSSLLFDGVRVITNVDVEKEIKEQLDNVSKIVYLPRPELQVLLHHFGWNEQNMLDALKADEKLVLKQAGIYVQNEDSSEKKNIAYWMVHFAAFFMSWLKTPILCTIYIHQSLLSEEL